jgi:hypothetical protein
MRSGLEAKYDAFALSCLQGMVRGRLIRGRPRRDRVLVWACLHGSCEGGAIRQLCPSGKPSCHHYLKRADAALTAAREEEDRIKEKIRPHVERYRRITGRKR